MNSFGKFLAIASIIGVVILFSIYNQTVPFKFEQGKLSTFLGGIFIIVLLVERATEIIVSVWRQTTAEKLKEELSELKKTPDRNDAVTAKNKELKAYQSETKEIALLTGFALSVIVCSAGVGLLGEVVDITKGNKHFLRAVDIVLTSGIIAGGSDAFHQFASALDTFFKISKEKMQNSKKGE